MRLWISLLSALLIFLPVASEAKVKAFDDTARGYAKMVRWNEWDSAMDYLDPKVLEEKPLSDLELQRLEQIRVTGYEELSRRTISKTEIAQLVEIRVVNVHTQAERTLRDRQVWRYDAKAKRWWLVSGLPDFSPKP